MSRAARSPFPRISLLSGLLVLGLSGCATKEFVQKEVDVVHLRINKLERQIGEAGQRIDANAGRIQAGEERLGRAEAGADSLHKRLDETQADLEGANRNLAGLLAGLNTANQRIDTNTREIADGRARVETLAQQLGAASQRVDGVFANLAQADARLAALETAGRHEAAMAPAASSSAPAMRAEAPVAAAVPETAPASLQERLERVDSLIDAVQQRISANSAAIEGSATRIGALESGLEAAGRRDAEAEAALQQTQAQIGTAQSRLAAAEQRIDANGMALREMDTRIETVAGGLRDADARLRDGEKHLGEMGERLDGHRRAEAALSQTAEEALARATAAGKLAEGRLLAETVLSDEVGFASNRAELSDAARQALGALVERLKGQNQGVFIEVQGHTDDSGRAKANLTLSRQRAEAVRDFLHAAGIPLHRLAVLAYGETRPVADNETLDGRAKNRRVVLVVLK
ncbi:MAG: OmpA family protein [Pseudomonadota bacterium]